MNLTVLFGVIITAFFADVTCEKLILPPSTFKPPTRGVPYIINPIYRPPPRKGPIIRTVRDVHDAPATGDFPNLPSNIDDVRLDPIRRHARSVDSPSAKRYGGGQSTKRESRNPGSTHPGFNRRNTRDVWFPQPPFEPRFPRPRDPCIPTPRPFPIYARAKRDIQFPGIRKPSHRDIIIPNWNPNVRTQPWQRIGGSHRNTRSVEESEAEE